MLKDYCYPAIFEKEENGYSLYFPDIKEAYTCGDNQRELFLYAREVLELSLEGIIEDKKDIPEASLIEDIKLQKNEKVVLINVTVDTKIKYVKKTLTIPESLNLRATKAGVNFSKVLTEALEQNLYADR